MSWNNTSLGQLCDDGGGEVKTGPFGSQLHQSDYSSEGTPVVMPKDIIGGRVSENSVARVDQFHVQRLAHHQLQVGDIVYGRRGDIGRCALITKKEAGWLCGTGCLRVTLGNCDVEPQFLFYFLNHPNTVTWIFNQAIGATMPNLNTGILRSLTVRYPSLPAQQRIAAILSAYDDLIENNTRRIAILEEMARRLYEEWFVHFRFPGHETGELDGDLPRGWSYAPLKTIARLRSGYAFKSKAFNEGGEHRLVTIKNVKDTGFDPYNVSRLDDVPANVPSHCHLEPGDILLSLTGNVGRVCVVFSGNFLLNQRVAKIEPTAADYHAFSYFTFRDSDFRKRLENLATGVAQQNLSPVKTEELPVLLPGHQLLRRFQAFAGGIMDQCRLLDETNGNLRAQRDLLLPKLVSGEIDVIGAAATLEAAE